jgi:hypothetical protein
MPLKQVKLNHLFDKSNRKLLKIELKLEYRKLVQRFKKLHLKTHIKKFYLLFIVLALIIPLFTINPSASQESKLLQLVGANQRSDNTPIVFAEPSNVIPEISYSNTSLYSKYTLKNNETFESLLARLTNLNKDSLVVNNPGKEFKPGSEVIIPSKNGLLIGYNKSSDSREISKGLEIPEIDVINQFKKEGEGYFFKQTDNPIIEKKEYDIRVSKSRYNISANTRVDIIPNAQNSSSNALPGEDLSDALNSFIANFKGQRHHDGNGWSMGECVSLVKRWQQFIGAAYGIWPGYNGYPRNAWAGYRAGNRGMAPDNATFGVMIVSDVNSLKPGDILVINTPTSHTGLATGRYNGNSYEVFDQNSPVGSVANFNYYSKSTFITALRYYKK